MNTTMLTNNTKNGTNAATAAAAAAAAAALLQQQQQHQQFSMLQNSAVFNVNNMSALTNQTNPQLQQLMATQSIFNSLTPEQRLVAQQFAAETFQMSILQQQEIPKNLKVISIKKILNQFFFFKYFFIKISLNYNF